MSLSSLWQWLFNAWIIGEIVISVATRTRRGQGDLQDRGTQFILWIVIVLSMTACGFLRHFQPLPVHVDHASMRLAALALLSAGLLVRVAAILTLGKSFSANVATHATQTINRSGLYAIVRHPSYLGMEIIFFAAGLNSFDWAGLAVAFIPPTLAVLYRIHVEEAALFGAFGDDYADYARATKRLLPGIY